MLKAICFLGFALTLVAGQLAAEPIKVHPDNPHYYLFNGKPTILITSAEHYGAVVNKDFDYVRYFDELKSYGLNYTRIYPGVLFEPLGKFIEGNTLAPKPASLIVPWARSNVPGYLVCGNKFDLDQWDPEYFKRLKDFMEEIASPVCRPEDRFVLEPAFLASREPIIYNVAQMRERLAESFRCVLGPILQSALPFCPPEALASGCNIAAPLLYRFGRRVTQGCNRRRQEAWPPAAILCEGADS
jgi:hypothetical protein